jgi:hypothetical protein
LLFFFACSLQASGIYHYNRPNTTKAYQKQPSAALICSHRLFSLWGLLHAPHLRYIFGFECLHDLLLFGGAVNGVGSLLHRWTVHIQRASELPRVEQLVKHPFGSGDSFGELVIFGFCDVWQDWVLSLLSLGHSPLFVLFLQIHNIRPDKQAIVLRELSNDLEHQHQHRQL